VQRIFSFLLLLFLPLAALADGMVIPTVAYPAKITIPDQRALICFSNGTERLVLETRFTGAGTNFAWGSAAGPAGHRRGHHRIVSDAAISVPATDYPQRFALLYLDLACTGIHILVPMVVPMGGEIRMEYFCNRHFHRDCRSDFTPGTKISVRGNGFFDFQPTDLHPRPQACRRF
jgi:hypothetical protein